MGKGEGAFLTGGEEEGEFVGVGFKADVSTAHVVDDEERAAFRAEFAAGVFEDVVGLGGEADNDGFVSVDGGWEVAQGEEDVARGDEFEEEGGGGAFFELGGGEGSGAEIGDGGAEDDGVGGWRPGSVPRRTFRRRW